VPRRSACGRRRAGGTHRSGPAVFQSSRSKILCGFAPNPPRFSLCGFPPAALTESAHTLPRRPTDCRRDADVLTHASVHRPIEPESRSTRLHEATAHLPRIPQHQPPPPPLGETTAGGRRRLQPPRGRLRGHPAAVGGSTNSDVSGPTGRSRRGGEPPREGFRCPLRQRDPRASSSTAGGR
jgi:hypothetical protein